MPVHRTLIAALAVASAGCEAEPRSGAAVWLSACATCHGAEAQGTSDAPALDDVAWGAEAFEVAETIREGSGEMAPVSLPEAEIEAVAAYVVERFLR